MLKWIKHIMVSISLVMSINMTAQMAMPDTVCVGTSKTYSVNDPSVPSTYSWKIDGVMQSATANTFGITWNTRGNFLLTVQEHSSSGCDGNIQSGYVYVYPQILPVRYLTINTKANSPVQLQSRIFTSADKYSWLPSRGLNTYNISNPIFNYNNSIEYFIKISTATGCSVVDTLAVNILPLFPANSPSEIYVPNAFSPNGDGKNDILTPIAVNIASIKYFKIFNRWGQIVFETTKQGHGWNGFFKGVISEPGVFVWIVDAVGNDGKQIKKQGTFVLIR